MPPTVKSGIRGQLKSFSPSTYWLSSFIVMSMLIVTGYLLLDWRAKVAGTNKHVVLDGSYPEKDLIDISIDQPIVIDQIPQDSIDTEINVIAKQNYIVAKGDTLFAILLQYGINAADILKLIKQYPKISQLSIGQQISWEADAQSNLISLEWQISRRLLHKYILSNGNYEELVQIREGHWNEVILSGAIKSNFILAAREAGLNNNEINSVIKALQWKVDFNKLPTHSAFTAVFSQETLDNQLTDSILLAVTLSSKGIKYNAYLADDGHYYDDKGHSLASGFLRYPLHKRARISSGFNPRRLHPITGKVTPHNGVDFAIPTGTPILASGDGEVVLAKYSGAAGNYIAIRHGRQYLTRYMHLSKILVKVGQKIKRGDTIALSGNTGLSTGPHLHYEFHVNGKPVNPMTITLPTADGLTGEKLAVFQRHINKWKQMLALN